MSKENTEHHPRFEVRLRGRAFYVVDSKTGMLAGGPYRTREAAFARMDALEAVAGR